MSISTEEKDRYLRETAIVLAREGFQTGKTDTGKLRVLLDGAPLCEVTENGGITYRNEDINEPERVAAKDMVYEIVRNTAEYMRQMETAPFLKADGLEDSRCPARARAWPSTCCPTGPAPLGRAWAMSSRRP